MADKLDPTALAFQKSLERRLKFEAFRSDMQRRLGTPLIAIAALEVTLKTEDERAAHVAQYIRQHGLRYDKKRGLISKTLG